MKSETDSKVTEFFAELNQHWLRYIALIVTGSLTGYAVWSFTFNALYVLATIALAEGASLYWTKRVEDYGNQVQLWCAGIGAVLAWTAIILTDLSSATIIASTSNIQIFSVFKQVPEWAQRTVVYVVPLLAVIHGVLATLHYFFSEIAEMRRNISADIRQANYEIKKATAQTSVAIAKAQAQRYVELASTQSANVGYDRAEKQWAQNAGLNTGTKVGAEENFTQPPSKK